MQCENAVYVSRNLIKKMGQAGYQRVHTEGIFTTETLAKRTECIYDQWLRDLRPSLQTGRAISQQPTEAERK